MIPSDYGDNPVNDKDVAVLIAAVAMANGGDFSSTTRLASSRVCTHKHQFSTVITAPKPTSNSMKAPTSCVSVVESTSACLVQHVIPHPVTTIIEAILSATGEGETPFVVVDIFDNVMESYLKSV